MQKKTFIITTAVILVGGATVWGVAQAGPGQDPLRFGVGRRMADSPVKRLVQAHVGRMITLASDLNVTDEQRERLRVLGESYRPEFEPVVKKMVANRRALRKAVLAKETDEAAVRAAAAEVGKTMGDIALLISQVAADARGTMTEKQLERMDTFWKDCDGAIDRWIQDSGE